MNKILRIIETESCSVCQAYYIAHNILKNDFDRFGRHDKIEQGFTQEFAEKLGEIFKQIGIKDGTTTQVDIFDLADIDKYPLPNIGPIFAPIK